MRRTGPAARKKTAQSLVNDDGGGDGDGFRFALPILRRCPSGAQCCKFGTTGKSAKTRQVPKPKIFRFTGILIYGMDRLSPCHQRDVSRSSRSVVRVAMGRSWRQVISSPDETFGSGRRNRVVLAPRPWRNAGGSLSAGNGGKKGRFPGESTYKP